MMFNGLVEIPYRLNAPTTLVSSVFVAGSLELLESLGVLVIKIVIMEPF